ncbi:MAG: Tm-1-like ATP-binding domain-containing protein [Opitutales bacterium]
MPPVIALLGALDTKGDEYRFLKDRLESSGLRTWLIDVGVLSDPALQPDTPARSVALAAGADLEELRSARDRGHAVTVMGRGARSVLGELHAEGKIQGVIALGGTGGTSVACEAMRALPLGVPKVMVSTAAGGDVSGYVGVADIVMVPSVVDVAGINRVSREVFARAAGAIAGMVQADIPRGEERPVIAASMFGNTTPCIDLAREELDKAGYDTLVFHCTGNGGRTLESLVRAGRVAGVLDLTTTEWADEIVGGVFAAGPERLSAAALTGTPAVIAPGCLDMVNFNAPETIPDRFAGRTFYRHNPNVTLMRTSPAECRAIAQAMAEQINRSTGPVTVLIPHHGVSMIDLEGQPFHDPEATEALFDTLKEALRPDIPVLERDCAINDPAFAREAVRRLLEAIDAKPAPGTL